MFLEIQDQDKLQALEILEEVGINAKAIDDREVTWIGDSLLQALYNISETQYDTKESISKMAAEIEWRLYEGEDRKLSLLNRLREEYFYNYVRDRILGRIENQ